MKHETAVIETPSCGRIGSGFRGAKIGLILFILLFATESAGQPQAALKTHPQKVHLNRLLRVTLEVLWAGEADVYDIPQPDSSALSEFEVLGQKLSATRRGRENLLKYELTMKPLKQGEYDIGRIRIKYFEKGKDIPIAIDLPRTMVKVVPPELLGSGAKIGIAIGAGTAAALAALGLILRSKKAGKNKQLSEYMEAGHTRQSLLAKLDKARPLLIEGHDGEYLEKLCELAESDILLPFADRTDDLRDLTENTKFGGQAATPDQLKWAEKLVRNAILKAFPEDDEQEEFQ